MQNNKEKGKLLVYTRKPVEGSYTASLGNSIHMAYSSDGVTYEPLNQNYGIVFASACISPRNTINEKGLKNPHLFTGPDITYGIMAVRTDAEGKDDAESKGCILLWTSEDLIHFRECGLICLKKDVYVQAVTCNYRETEGIYEICWTDTEGNYFINTATCLENGGGVSEADKGKAFCNKTVHTNIAGIVPGNVLNVEKGFGEKLLLHWSPVRNIAVTVRDCVKAVSEEDVMAVKATAVYSDGSTAEKIVVWDTSGVDFSRKGLYEVHGKAVQERYTFPLAVGYADPDVFRWNNKYYFIATNDNTNAVGLFVREADTVAGLFEKGIREHIILDFDKERQLVKTFWAPEFHVIDDNLYVLFAVGGESGGPQSHMMRLKNGGDILNPADWEKPVRVKKKDGTNLTDEGITLDMTYLNVDGTSYLVWSFRVGFGTQYDTGSMLYIAATDPKAPWTLTGEPVLLSRPLLGWENNHGTVNNEGPYALLTPDTVYLAFSGGAAGGWSYAVGLLSIGRQGNLLNPAEWNKTCTPVLSHYSVEGEYGPGHNTFFTGGDGNMMIAYHAQETSGNTHRCTGIRRVHFDRNGTPVLDMCADRDLNEELAHVKMNVEIGN